jgi:hypothetical protein
MMLVNQWAGMCLIIITHFSDQLLNNSSGQHEFYHFVVISKRNFNLCGACIRPLPLRYDSLTHPLREDDTYTRKRPQPGCQAHPI